MKIFNLMLGRARGGLEQAAVDYAEALRLAQAEVVTLTSPDAWVNSALDSAQLPRLSFTNYGSWDPFAVHKLRNLARSEEAGMVICHGNRALRLALKAFRGMLPVIAVTHNYSIDDVKHAQGVLTITRDLALEVELGGVEKSRIFHIPNMVRTMPEVRPHTLYQKTPVIGSMGRFVRKKAFDVYLEAIAILNARGVHFKAVLGGTGEDETDLRALAEARHLHHTVEFTGWVEDKRAFFENIDFFVLPSHHEPFGIVLIEAMAYGLPCITTDAEGPSEIVHAGVDALLVPRNDPEKLADAMQRLIEDHAYAAELATAGLALVNTHYSMEAMARRLREAIETLSQSQLNIAA